MKNSDGQSIHSGWCNWCDSGDGVRLLPKAFCWTRMQAESGQTLDSIIQRKELERAIGEGVFYWGIGNALGDSVLELVRRTTQPEVFFSVMRAKPKHVDVSPSTVLLWTEFMDTNGRLQPLPSHTLVLSRGDTATGRDKRNYALVCYSEAALSLSAFASLDLSHLRNLGGNRQNVGFSQVTAIVEHVSAKQVGVRYEASLRAFLKPPYFVRLAGAVKISDKDREAIKLMIETHPTPDIWRGFTQDIRTRHGCAQKLTESFTLSSE